ncbi:unnamed protein product, partial [Cyprideis torosa]
VAAGCSIEYTSTDHCRNNSNGGSTCYCRTPLCNKWSPPPDDGIGPSQGASLKCYHCSDILESTPSHWLVVPCGSKTVLDCGRKEVVEVLGPSNSCMTGYDWDGELVFATCSREDLNTCREALHPDIKLLGKECFCQTSLCNGDSLKCYHCSDILEFTPSNWLVVPCGSKTVLDCGRKEVVEVLGPSNSCMTGYAWDGEVVFASCSREDLNTCRDALHPDIKPLGKECFCQTSLCNGNSFRCYHCRDEPGAETPCDAQKEVDCLYDPYFLTCMAEYDADGKMVAAGCSIKYMSTDHCRNNSNGGSTCYCGAPLCNKWSPPPDDGIGPSQGVPFMTLARAAVPLMLLAQASVPLMTFAQSGVPLMTIAQAAVPQMILPQADNSSLECYHCLWLPFTESSQKIPCDNLTKQDCGSKEVVENLGGPSKSCRYAFDADGRRVLAGCSREDLNTCRDALHPDLKPLGKECFCQTSLCNGNSLRCYRCWDEDSVGISCDAPKEVECHDPESYGTCRAEYNADGKSLFRPLPCSTPLGVPSPDTLSVPWSVCLRFITGKKINYCAKKIQSSYEEVQFALTDSGRKGNLQISFFPQNLLPFLENAKPGP